MCTVLPRSIKPSPPFMILCTLFFFFILPGLLRSAAIDLSVKRFSNPRRPLNEQDQADFNYIQRRLLEKMEAALTKLPPKRGLPWCRVEIVSGWPRSVYILESSFWGKHDIAALRAAIDSVQIRAIEDTAEKPLSADELQVQLVDECERLGVLKVNGVIDWNRLAVANDFLLLTTTHYRKWNIQDRRIIQRLIGCLKSADRFPILDASVSFNKHSETIRVKKRQGCNDLTDETITNKKPRPSPSDSDKQTQSAQDDPNDFSGLFEFLDENLADYQSQLPVIPPIQTPVSESMQMQASLPIQPSVSTYYSSYSTHSDIIYGIPIDDPAQPVPLQRESSDNLDVYLDSISESID